MNSGANARLSARLGSTLTWLRHRLKKCPDTEPEQGIIRLGVGISILTYLYWVGFFADFPHDETVLRHRMIAIWFLLSACGLLAAMIIHPAKSVSRRGLGMIVDLSCTSYVMYSVNTLAAPMFVVYLWITFGNGFRYGRKYL